MRQILAALAITSLSLPLHAALDPAAQRADAAGKKKDKPAAEEPAKSPSLLKKIFGSKPKATPTPAPTPEPKSRPKPKAKTPGDEMPEAATPKTTVKTPTKTPATPAATKPKPVASGPKKTDPTVPAVPVDEAAKFRAAKEKAQEDEKIKELKGKAYAELDDTAAAKALTAYNRALFQKIREIDPGVSDYATKVEHALTKRVSGEKGKE